jgi:hypothetical protein
MKPEDITMDFFSKLDNGQYEEFKTTIINCLQMKSVQPPKDLNEIFTLANTYLKPKVVTGTGRMGSTFATTADNIEKKLGEGRGKRQRGKNAQGQSKDEKTGNEGADRNDGPGKKKPKCFSCGWDHYINNCPEFLEFKKMKEEEKQAAVTWDATTFVTYQVNAIGLYGFKPTEVLLDNQANVSIMRPELLSAFEKMDTEVRINGVGGVQLSTDETGYLAPDFSGCTQALILRLMY